MSVTATPTAKPAAAKTGGLIRSSMVYSFFTLISRVLGFARDLAITYYLGASATFAADAYNMGFSFPNLFRRIFAEGAFASAFVPAYSKALATEGEEAADLLAADAMAVLAAGAIAVTILAELSMPWLMYLIAPGFLGPKHDLAVRLTQIMMPYLPCMAIYAHLSGVLNGRNRFIFSAAAPILLNLWTLIAVWPAHNTLQAAYYASWGVIVAGVSQAALLWWGVRRSGANVDIRRPRLTPAIRALIGLAVPGAIAASGAQVNIFISSMLVSQVNGARSWLTVCDRLYMLPQSLVGVAIGVALLPRLSRHVHAGDKLGGHKAIDEAVVFSLALSLPAAAALVAMPYFLIDGLYTRGEFTHFDAQATASALLQYGWGVPAFVLAQLFNRVFFASQDTRAPMRYTLISAAVNVVAGVTLFHFVGVAGIAAATSLAAWVNVLLMLGALHRRGLYEPSAKTISRLIRVVVASAVLGGLLATASHFRPAIEGLLHGHRLGPLGPKEIVIVSLSALAAVAFPFLLFASGGLTIAEVKGALRRRPGESNKTVPGAQDLG
ncbi:murein biosynthesis integral membrane protein MurJ [Phenylobacterium sp.]|uniref:murein biosynthesis integral membrane protein MurJ n=1 Tax=Phenylobacterium sp. TaxID=1871053 RepID=UPI00120C7A41|nr:murein biosynthesis integral membrane protein MurJ [Phenylobacterium sp.]THD60738.1 MAG: murein biosynthesis integral membrane protein MurJ [Phenylobacterium sp.]